MVDFDDEDVIVLEDESGEMVEVPNTVLRQNELMMGDDFD